VDVCTAHLTPELVKGSKVVICGGGLSGADSALELAMNGKDVTVIEMRDGIAIDTAFINRQSIMGKMKEFNVKALVKTTVKKITAEGVIVTDAEGNEKLIPADTVITAFGVKANKTLAEKIQDAYPDAVLIGDCEKTGNIGTAIHDGFTRAYAIS
jgi:thioredoxin reductase